ncbi:POK6 protein, partial [Podargus strigoides]|nr:POK6 protein [Podargus strigoides]
NIKPQTLQITNKTETLNDLQKLLGTINWVRPMLRIGNHELSHLFSTLKCDSDLLSK